MTDSKNSTKSGRSLEILGNYDSRIGEASDFKADRITYWMSNGAQASDTVHNLLLDKKIITGKKINTLPKKSPIIAEEKAAEKTPEAPKESVKEEQAETVAETVA